VAISEAPSPRAPPLHGLDYATCGGQGKRLGGALKTLCTLRLLHHVPAIGSRVRREEPRRLYFPMRWA
jgi:hypothetical protein